MFTPSPSTELRCVWAARPVDGLIADNIALSTCHSRVVCNPACLSCVRLCRFHLPGHPPLIQRASALQARAMAPSLIKRFHMGSREILL